MRPGRSGDGADFTVEISEEGQIIEQSVPNDVFDDAREINGFGGR